MKLSDKLKALRKEAGYSQEYIGEVCHVSRQAVSRWEAEDAYPDLSNLILLSNLYHVSIDYLVKEEMEIDYYQEVLRTKEKPTSYIDWMHIWCHINLKGYSGWEDPYEPCVILDENEQYLFLQVYKKKKPCTFGILAKKSIASLSLLRKKEAGKMPAIEELPKQLRQNPFSYFVGMECDILKHFEKFRDIFTNDSYFNAHIESYHEDRIYGVYYTQTFIVDTKDIIRICVS